MALRSTLRTQVRVFLDEVTERFYDDDYINSAINFANKEVGMEILQKLPDLLTNVQTVNMATSTNYSSIGGGQKISLPTNFYGLIGIEHRESSTDSPTSIAVVSKQGYYAAETGASYHGLMGSSYVATLVADKPTALTAHQMQIWLYPEITTGYLYMTYFWLPEDMDEDTDDNQLPPAYDLLVSATAAQILIIKEGSTQRFQLLQARIADIRNKLFSWSFTPSGTYNKFLQGSGS